MNLRFGGLGPPTQRTVQLGSGDNFGLGRPLIHDTAVSGWDESERLAQNPAESREFLELDLDVRGKSLQQQTKWRREWDSNPR